MLLVLYVWWNEETTVWKSRSVSTTEGWHASIDPGDVSFITSCSIHLLGNTSNGGMKGPVGLVQLMTVTSDPRSADWTEDTWRSPFNPNIFVSVLYNSDGGLVAIVKSCRIMLNGAHSGFVDLQILSYWFSSEAPRSWEWRPSVALTEICGWRCRKFLNHFLPVFSFLVQNWFLIPFLTASR